MNQRSAFKSVSRRRWAASLLLASAPLTAALAQEAPDASVAEEQAEAAPRQPRLRFSVEAKAQFRDSDENAYPSPPRTQPTALQGSASGLGSLVAPVHTSASLATVNEGSHLELSTVTLYADAEWGGALVMHAKIDVVDLYDRNPTSSDHNVDVDEAWIRFGREAGPAELPERPGAYLKVGKFPKFERQNDRHLESYGLVSTAFNRFEDSGLEVGADLGRYLYLKASLTQGNPVFIRDPNALAGDNGTTTANSRLGSGIPLLYDAEVEDLDLDGDLEVGAGLGMRWENASRSSAFDLLVWGYRRKLANTVALNGTIYPGDLDFLNGPITSTPLPLTDDDKQELGGNLRLHFGGFSFFGQYVDQELGGLKRRGFEGEVAWTFELPVVWGVGGSQLFSYLAPAVRYSKLEPEFAGGSVLFPYPSVRAEWEKIDFGLRLGILDDIDLTIEYADHQFTIVSDGSEGENNELLATLRFKI